MKILVTGGTGFVGKNLTETLLAQGHDVTVTSYPNENEVSGAFYLHITNLPEIDDVFDVVFHQAANNNTRDMDRFEMFRSNIYDPIVMFHKLKERGCRKFIYASSTSVYGNQPAPYIEDTPVEPLNPYAESKLAFDEFAIDFAQGYNVSVIGLRYCNIYGPYEDHKGSRMSMIGQMLRKGLAGETIALFNYGEQKRDWVHVNDVVSANLCAMQAGRTGIYNIGSGSSHTFNELVHEITERLQRGVTVSLIDCPFADQYQNHTECNITKAIVELGYSPSYDLEKGIEHYLKFLT